MGTIYNRGRRDRPHWWVKFKDADGVWKAVPSHQPTKEQARRYLLAVEARVAQGNVGIAPTSDAPRCGPLMDEWAKSLANRNARDDRNRLAKHVRPAFEKVRLRDVTVGRVMDWVDRQRVAEKRLSAASIRHNLNLLSRFFSWAVERGHASVNPVRQIPVGRRPQQAQKRDVPWLDDDKMVRVLVSELPEPIGLMFYVGNRSGLRTGEIAGLRMADLGYLAEGALRVRFSYGGPLKEDKGGVGKMKWVPAADDAEAVLGPWLDRRRAEGAGPEDLAFPCPARGRRKREDGEQLCYRKEFIESSWEAIAEAKKLELTWYEATRHSFVTRSLERGASLDEVSSAVGHSSPVVTRRYYDHFVRRRFSDAVRGGLGFSAPVGAPAEVVPLRRSPTRSDAGDAAARRGLRASKGSESSRPRVRLRARAARHSST